MLELFFKKSCFRFRNCSFSEKNAENYTKMIAEPNKNFIHSRQMFKLYIKKLKNLFLILRTAHHCHYLQTRVKGQLSLPTLGLIFEKGIKPVVHSLKKSK